MKSVFNLTSFPTRFSSVRFYSFIILHPLCFIHYFFRAKSKFNFQHKLANLNVKKKRQRNKQTHQEKKRNVSACQWMRMICNKFHFDDFNFPLFAPSKQLLQRTTNRIERRNAIHDQRKCLHSIYHIILRTL